MRFSKKIHEFISWPEIPPKKMRILNPFGGRPKPACFSGTFSVYKNEEPSFDVQSLKRSPDLNYVIWYYPGRLCAPTIKFAIPIVNGKKFEIKTRIDGANGKWLAKNRGISYDCNFTFYKLTDRNSSRLFISGGLQIFGIMDEWIAYFLLSDQEWTYQPAGVVINILEALTKDDNHSILMKKIANS